MSAKKSAPVSIPKKKLKTIDLSEKMVSLPTCNYIVSDWPKIGIAKSPVN